MLPEFLLNCNHPNLAYGPSPPQKDPWDVTRLGVVGLSANSGLAAAGRGDLLGLGWLLLRNDGLSAMKQELSDVE